MPRGRPKKDAVVLPDEPFLDVVVVPNEKPKDTNTDKQAEEIPSINDVAWTPYVLSLLQEDEVFEGAPTVDGLRRIAHELLGDVISSVSEVAGSPDGRNGGVATVLHHLTIDCEDGKIRQYSGVADVHDNNTDPEYARFASATAETRAEGRAYKRALRLRKVVTVEELTTVALEAKTESDKVNDSQLTMIKFLCSKLNINVLKFVNMGEKQYESVHDISHPSAVKMIGVLNKYQQNTSNIPEKVLGYDSTFEA